MESAMASPSRNHLLSLLSSADAGLLEPHLEPVTLAKLKSQPNTRITAVYFPEGGFASVVAQQRGGEEAEVGLIGREGMTGLPVILGIDRTPHATYIQAAGAGQCIRSSDLRTAMQASQSLRDLFLRWVQAFNVQTAHTAICNARSRLDQRLARWLLMAHDRLDDGPLALTDEFLALMLAVRRAGVTEAVHMLESRGLINRTRGRIMVLNRKGLERLAADAYGAPEAEYRRLLN
jgi:CRP-like cAMP-binding protein